MPRLALVAFAAAVAAGSVATAADWKPFAAGPNGAQWFYDADYSYRDATTGRVVVMQAIGKPQAKVGPNGPGAADGVGSVVAIDCQGSNLLTVASYAPSTTPDLTSTAWRDGKPKKIGKSNAEDQALMTAACAGADQLPSK
jgi:hypothetical protein